MDETTAKHRRCLRLPVRSRARDALVRAAGDSVFRNAPAGSGRANAQERFQPIEGRADLARTGKFQLIKIGRTVFQQKAWRRAEIILIEKIDILNVNTSHHRHKRNSQITRSDARPSA
jgi:hypothetical protein